MAARSALIEAAFATDASDPPTSSAGSAASEMRSNSSLRGNGSRTAELLGGSFARLDGDFCDCHVVFPRWLIRFFASVQRFFLALPSRGGRTSNQPDA